MEGELESPPISHRRSLRRGSCIHYHAHLLILCPDQQKKSQPSSLTMGKLLSIQQNDRWASGSRGVAIGRNQQPTDINLYLYQRQEFILGRMRLMDFAVLECVRPVSLVMMLQELFSVSRTILSDNCYSLDSHQDQWLATSLMNLKDIWHMI